MNSKNIEQRFAYTTLAAKASMVEIFNKTLQQKMLRWFSVNDMNYPDRRKNKSGESFQTVNRKYI